MVSGVSMGPTPMGCGRPSASTGVKCILLYHLLENIVFFALSIGDLIIFRSPQLRLTSKYSSRLAVAGYAFLGAPLIAAAFWAVVHRAEKPLRCYFYYLTVSIVVNTAYTIDALVHFLPCAAGKMPSTVSHPDIFACGHPRGIMLLSLAFVVGFQFCMAYPVYTYCEDLKWDSEGPEQRAANEDKEGSKLRPPTRRLAIAAQWASFRNGPLNHIQGRMVGEYGSVYETAAAIGAGQAVGAASSGSSIMHLPATRLV
mmetsp:Transcript_52784/g.168974  ORF Transcript_52784/g.168974 Transcript_52784/m.168974 type:complete len:256 (+) Transcript_52784:104-871(+)